MMLTNNNLETAYMSRDQLKGFPTVIHWIWFQGVEQLPEKYMVNISSFITQNPGWTTKLWDGCTLEEECKKYGSKCLTTFRSFRYMHQKIDFGKYVVAARHGGVCVDMDMIALRPFKDIVKVAGKDLAGTDLIVSCAPVTPIETKICMIGTGLRCMYNNGWIMCKRKCKAMISLVDHISLVQNRLQYIDIKKLDKFACIMASTGPIVFTVVLAKAPRVLTLDKKYFESSVGYRSDAKRYLSRDAFVVHQHHNTWVPIHRQALFKLWYRLQSTFD